MAIHETQVGTAQSAIWADQCSSSLSMCRSVITPKRRPEMRRYARICPILLPCTRDEVSRPPHGSRLSCGELSAAAARRMERAEASFVPQGALFLNFE